LFILKNTQVNDSNESVSPRGYRLSRPVPFPADPLNPPSPTRFKIPKYTRNRKLTLSGAGSSICENYIVARNPKPVSTIVEKSTITLCHWIELIFIWREKKM